MSYRLWVCTVKGSENTKQKRNAVDSDWVWYKHHLQDQIGLFYMHSVGVGHLRPVHSNIPPTFSAGAPCASFPTVRGMRQVGLSSLSLPTSFQWIALLRVCVFSFHLLWLYRKLRKGCLLQFYCRAPFFTTCKRLYLQHHRESSFTRTISSLLISGTIIQIPRSAGKSVGR